jgi:hypothetical protein
MAPALEMVRVDPALQVVVLVLQAAGEEAGAMDGDGLSRHRETLDDRVVVAFRARFQARE